MSLACVIATANIRKKSVFCYPRELCYPRERVCQFFGGPPAASTQHRSAIRQQIRGQDAAQQALRAAHTRSPRSEVETVAFKQSAVNGHQAVQSQPADCAPRPLPRAATLWLRLASSWAAGWSNAVRSSGPCPSAQKAAAAAAQCDRMPQSSAVAAAATHAEGACIAPAHGLSQRH